MKHRIFSYLIFVLMLFSVFMPCLSTYASAKDDTAIVEVTDQGLPEGAEKWNHPISWGNAHNNGFTQSFIPSVTTLSKIEVLFGVCRDGMQYVNLTIYPSTEEGKPDIWNPVFQHGYGSEYLLEHSRTVITHGDQQGVWISLEVPEISTVPGNKYFFTIDAEDFNWATWIDKEWDIYPDGEMWTFVGLKYGSFGGFVDSDKDLFFRTYGYGTTEIPVADAGEDMTVMTMDTVNFDGSGSYDPDGSIASYTWDFGDGASASGVKVTHTYADDGIYNVTLVVMDNYGVQSSDVCTVTVLNRAPMAEAGSDITVLTMESITFSGRLSHDLDGEIVNYTWDFGDGTYGFGKTVTHSYADDGTYMVNLTVTDDDGFTGEDHSVVTVINRKPVADFEITTGKDVLDGENISAELRITGCKWNSVELEILEDNSTIANGTLTREHGNPNDQILLLNFTVHQSANYTTILTFHGRGSTPAWLTISWNNRSDTTTMKFKHKNGEYQNKTVELNPILTNLSWGYVIVDASESYDADGDIVSYTWALGDGTNASGIRVIHDYLPGNYTIVLTVTDSDGDLSQSSKNISISQPHLKEPDMTIIESKNGATVSIPSVLLFLPLPIFMKKRKRS